jgi:hypothetical protein
MREKIQLNNGDLVSIKSKANNKFVCAIIIDNSTLLIASSRSVALETESCEIFILVFNNDSERTVSFNSAANNKYISVGRQGFVLGVNKINKNNESEKFIMKKNTDGSYSLISKLNNQYVCAEYNGEAPLVANRLFKQAKNYVTLNYSFILNTDFISVKIGSIFLLNV